MTRTEASRVPELLATRQEYSPESAGDTWFSLSRGPWTWPGWGESGESEPGGWWPRPSDAPALSYLYPRTVMHHCGRCLLPKVTPFDTGRCEVCLLLCFSWQEKAQCLE